MTEETRECAWRECKRAFTTHDRRVKYCAAECREAAQREGRILINRRAHAKRLRRRRFR